MEENAQTPEEIITSKKPAPFPVVAVRTIAKQALLSKDTKRGITMKAGYLLSIAAGKLLEQIAKEAAEHAKNMEPKVITKAQIIEICMKNPRYRFAVSLIKMNEMQQYFGQPNELSRRIVNSILNRPFSLAVPFVAPNPPGGAGNSEEDALFREAENTKDIISSLSMSVSAYMNHVPSFFKNQE